MELIPFILEQIEEWGAFIYLLIFVVAIFESFVLTGIFIPGTFLVIFIGFLAAQKVLDIYFLILITAVGAAIGDILSFYLGGHKGVVILGRIEKHFKVDYLKIGEDFFGKYGDKSLLIGRFVAVVRPFIPFVAGLFKMNIKKFLFWNFLSAFLWATLYLMLGYFFGAALNAIVEWSERISITVLVVIVFGAISYFVRNKFTKPPKQ